MKSPHFVLLVFIVFTKLNAMSHNLPSGLGVGTPEDETLDFRHLINHNEDISVAILHGLSKDGKSMLEWLPEFGFITEGGPRDDIPLGFAIKEKVSRFYDYSKIGITCAACHSGGFEYEGEFYVVDGMPAMIDFEGWILLVSETLNATLKNPVEVTKAFRRSLQYSAKYRRKISFKDSNKRLMSNALEMARSLRPKRKRYLHSLRQLAVQIKKQNNLLGSLNSSHAIGRGRDGPWSVVDLLLGGSEEAYFKAPVSPPPLYGVNDFHWFHYDGNTNSTMGRNIIQALTLGVDFDLETGATDLTLAQLEQLDKLVSKLRAPKWPVFFPEIDEKKRKKGENIFHGFPAEYQGSYARTNKRLHLYNNYLAWDVGNQLLDNSPKSCFECHHTPEKAEDQEFYNVGTSALRWSYFHDREESYREIVETLSKVRRYIIKNSKVSDDYTTDKYDGPWYIRSGYVARPLNGIWASSPYLHNGSVPTLFDMINSSKRPEVFYQDSLEFDPIKVGYKVSLDKGKYKFDIKAHLGNRNQGHSYGQELSEEEKSYLLEYLKSL